MNHDLNSARMNLDDPLLTAYALGELDGAEAAAMERRLAGDASLREEVAAIRSVGSSLRAGFAAEPAATLTELQRSRVMRKPATPLRQTEVQSRAILNSPRIFLLRSRWIGAGLTAAAVIALTVTAAILFNRGPSTTDNVAMSRTEAANESRGGTDSAAAFDDREQAPMPAGDASIVESLSKKENLDRAMRSAQGVENALEMDAGGAGSRGGLAAEAAAASEGAPPTLASVPPMPAPASPAPAATDPRPSGGIVGGGGGGDAQGGRGGAAAPGAVARPETERTRGQQESPPSAKPAPPPETDTRSAPGNAAGEDKLKDGVARRSGDKPAPAESAPAARDDKNPATGAAGSLRQPPPAQQPQDDAEKPVDLLEEKQIEQMEEPEIRSALLETEQLREKSDADSLRRQLFRQAENLRARLRTIEVRDAEEYSRINDNPFVKPTGVDALSTFAADVDTASYSNVRRFLDAGGLPPADAVRIEEMINYFRYDYDPPTAADGDAPFKANVEVGEAPWNPKHRLVRVGLRGKEIRKEARPATSLVFLVDVSGSMDEPRKLPLVKHALNLLVRQLHGDDRLAIVTYRGNAGLVLDSCYVNADNRVKIEEAIESMSPGGSTNGAGGIQVAYDVARQHFIKDGVNRVILCTDGDFNVGVSSDEELVRLITEQRSSNVFLSVLGFGTGNLKDAKMEKLADSGNGNFAYIDSRDEAERVLVKEMDSMLVAIAKDVKFQIEFNPAKVGAYRLIGYENRLLAAEDFNDDAKDAGEIGSGHMMTALYEIVPPGEVIETAPAGDNAPADNLDEFKFQKHAAANEPWSMIANDDLAELKIRYKRPNDDAAQATMRIAVTDESKAANDTGDDFRFAAAVAEFGMLLRRSPHKAGATFEHVLAQAEGALGADRDGYRAQFMELVRKAQRLESGK